LPEVITNFNPLRESDREQEIHQRRPVRPCIWPEGNRISVRLTEWSLAQARRAGETPSRPAASHPARRSRATTQRPLPPTPYLGTDDYAWRLIDPTMAMKYRIKTVSAA